MAHVAAHSGDRSDRDRVTVAELLARPRIGAASSAGAAPAGCAPASGSGTPDWAVPALSSRQRATRVTGAVLAIGSIVATAALCGQPEHGPMSTGAGDGGHPSSLPLRPAPDPVPTERPAHPVAARAPEQRPPRSRPVSRPRQQRATVQPAPAPAPVRPAPRREPEPEPTAGSALSRLTPSIEPDLVLDLGGGLLD